MSLSPRQKRFVRKNADGMSPSALAKHLGVSRKDVETYLDTRGAAGGDAVDTPAAVFSLTHWLVLGIILAATFTAYTPAIHAQFAFDDEHHVVENHALWEQGGVARILTDPEAFSGRPGSRMYRPVALLTLRANFAFSETEPLGFHLTNVLIHLGVVFVFVTALRLASLPPAVCLIAGAIFALHPAHSEPVLYVSARSALLAALFVWGSLACYLTYRRAPEDVRWLGASLGVFALGLFSKENAIVLVVFVPLVEEIVRDRHTARPWKAYAAFAAVAIAYVLVRNAVLDLPTVDVEHSDRTKGENLLTQASVFLTYVRLLFVPIQMTVDYDIPTYRSVWVAESPTWAQPVWGMVLVTGLTAAGAWAVWRRKAVVAGAGVLMALVAMAPESSIIALNQVANERRLYLPLSGAALALAMAWFVPWKRYAQIVLPTLVIAGICSGMLVHARAGAWISELRLWQEAARVSPYSVPVRMGLGLAYSRLGRKLPEGELQEYCLARAVRELLLTTRLSPGYHKTYSNLGITYMAQGKPQEAIYAFKLALQVNRRYDKAYSNLAAVYIELGYLDRAEALLRRALDIFPRYVEALNNLGIVLAEKAKRDGDVGLLREAAALFDRAMYYNPHFPDAPRNKAHVMELLEQAGAPPPE